MAPTQPDDHDLDVVSQICLASRSPLALLAGVLLGGIPPLATYAVGHHELPDHGWWSACGAICVGGILVSAKTVYAWSRRTFQDAWKAAGFTLLAEGAMSFTAQTWLGILILGLLIAINAIANASNLAIAHQAHQARTRPETAGASELAEIRAAVAAVTARVAPVENSLAALAHADPEREHKPATKGRAKRTKAKTPVLEASKLN